ncbi:MAG TPA: histidine phosphatase family protein [Chitinophagaceae bacterium]|nr:histidine phosphatase family protein [Chitinophagaceae bacterium]
MKTVLLVRHAKSSWDDPSQSDFERPLNKRGEKDAPEMAKRMLKKNVAIDALITSPAVRAYTTCKYFAEVYSINEKQIIHAPELYLAQPEIFYQVISKVNDEYSSIALFAHNPGISVFANILTNTRIDEMPTCAVFALQSDAAQWSDFRKSKKTFLLFDYPKAV